MNLDRPNRLRKGFTLLELAVTIAVIIILAGVGFLGVKPYFDYQDGRAASETLSSVKAAQLLYLADNPSTQVADLTQDLLLPYLPNGTWPALPAVSGQTQPTINCNVFPPTSSYDPSGSTTDNLWDTGK